MNRETERQIKRLEKLANFISANPDSYDQGAGISCIVGLGLRMQPSGKMSFDTPFWSDGAEVKITEFAKKFGIKYETAYNIFWGHWDAVNPKAKITWSLGIDGRAGKIRTSAVAILRYVARQKSLGKTL